MAELCLISFSSSELKLNPIGDILAIVAAFIWAVCSLLTRKSSRYGYNTIQTTRRIFAYGILFILSFLFVFDYMHKCAEDCKTRVCSKPYIVRSWYISPLFRYLELCCQSA